jgi:hypothetical protein
MHVEDYPGLAPKIVSYNETEFITSYELNNLQTVVRQTIELSNYDYNRVDFQLLNPSFHTFKIDTFEVYQNGDSVFYSKKYIESSVEIRNLKNDTISKMVLHSHKKNPIGWDCGYSYAKVVIDTFLVIDEVILSENLFSYNIENLDSTYYYSYGADFKLDENPDNNYIASNPTTSILDLENVVIKLFPNPMNEYFQVESDLKGVFNIELIDINGNFMFSRKAKISNLERIDVESIESGVYFVRIYNSRLSKTYKIVKI